MNPNAGFTFTYTKSLNAVNLIPVNVYINRGNDSWYINNEKMFLIKKIISLQEAMDVKVRLLTSESFQTPRK